MLCTEDPAAVAVEFVECEARENYYYVTGVGHKRASCCRVGGETVEAP
jgi:hypothetical protein